MRKFSEALTSSFGAMVGRGRKKVTNQCSRPVVTYGRHCRLLLDACVSLESSNISTVSRTIDDRNL